MKKSFVAGLQENIRPLYLYVPSIWALRWRAGRLALESSMQYFLYRINMVQGRDAPVIEWSNGITSSNPILRRRDGGHSPPDRAGLPGFLAK